ncbi:hypothetical protein PROVRETT_09988 [Providencia rettgeri DSM 1131]|nr:hypothetical protein PROVRETT_09988 [Providencia rettgeri DSM 1131]
MQVNFITNNKKISNHANNRGNQWTKKQIKKATAESNNLQWLSK